MTYEIRQKKEIAVIYTHFPHYRAAVFDALSRSDTYNYAFYYDMSGVDGTIRSGERRSNHYSTKVRSIGPISFQFGSILIAIRSRPDAAILLGNPFILSSWLASIIFKLRGIPVLFWTHGWTKRERGVKATIRKIFYRLADSLLLYGDRAKAIGEDLKFPTEKMYVVYNSLDYATQSRVRDRIERVQSQKPYFLTVTRLVKNVDIALILQALSKMPYETTLKIVGDGPERKKLEQLSRDLGVDAQFLGPVYDELILGDLFVNATAVVSPGKVGLLAMHALAYGSYVITHNDFDKQMPEFEAIREGLTGHFFNYGSVDDLRQAMSARLNAGVNYNQYSTAIKTIESRYTPSKQVEFIEEALTETFRRCL